MTSADLEPKVRQLDNDVQAIYELISTIESTQRRHTNRFAEIGADVTELKNRMSALEKRLEGVEARLEGHDARFDGLDGKLDQVLALLRG